MTLRELRYLVALADHEHFGRAAEECCVSQPTLSTQIKKLEGYLGVILIERNAKTFALTAVGQGIVEKARRIVRQVGDLQTTARTALGPLAGPLRLGVIPTLAPYLLPWLVPLAKRHYQRLQLVVHEDLTQHLVERLRNYEIDAALLALPLDGEDFEERGEVCSKSRELGPMQCHTRNPNALGLATATHFWFELCAGSDDW
jgi:LysR family transcriptional regulator, hydrogen peroxide-inducible genes activator